MNKIALIIFISLLAFTSCKKDNNNQQQNGNNVNECFFNSTINGVNYTNQCGGFFSFSDQNSTCSPKPYTLININQIDAAEWFLDCYLFHYQNNTDFSSSTIGTYDIYDAYNYIGNTSNACNLDLYLSLDHKTLPNQTTTLVTPISNQITSISLSDGSSNTKNIYVVKGTFSASFKDSENNIIPVSGSYSIPIDVLK